MNDQLEFHLIIGVFDIKSKDENALTRVVPLVAIVYMKNKEHNNLLPWRRKNIELLFHVRNCEMLSSLTSKLRTLFGQNIEEPSLLTENRKRKRTSGYRYSEFQLRLAIPLPRLSNLILTLGFPCLVLLDLKYCDQYRVFNVSYYFIVIGIAVA